MAVLKIEPKEALTVLALGNSDQTEVGEWVMAVGNPFGLGGNSVTVGVVSYKGRALTLGTEYTSVDMIQTDAAINPGNSGGPLLNTRGEVIGINTLIITRGVPQSAGVGFAVPINVAKEILPQLRTRGKVVRGWLGIKIQGLTDDMSAATPTNRIRARPRSRKSAITASATAAGSIFRCSQGRAEASSAAAAAPPIPRPDPVSSNRKATASASAAGTSV